MDFGLRGGGHCSDRSAVEGIVKGDDFVAAGFEAESPGELDESVVGFGTGVGEEDFAGVLDHFFDDEFGEFGLGLVEVEVGAVHQGGCLFRDGLCQSGVAMAERAGRDAGAEVEILTAGFVPDVGALAFRDGEGESSVGLENVLLCFFGRGHGLLVVVVVSCLEGDLEARRLIIKVARRVRAAPRSSMGPKVSSKKIQAPIPVAMGRRSWSEAPLETSR